MLARMNSMNGKWLSTIVIALLAALALPGCKDFPGADGRYATPGLRDQRHGSP
jgi:hypothetical protein